MGVYALVGDRFNVSVNYLIIGSCYIWQGTSVRKSNVLTIKTEDKHSQSDSDQTQSLSFCYENENYF